ncbi:retrotransposon protein, putative, ty1-copia subclass [Tanacetum coccineum]|uniref:Retrotransposon protein, putative, ty1-copia subclass n=1 Tax=Tanacetum coccineum TaxID=301880 RepID=A0ABQ5E8D1_9ASTR
MLKPVGSKWLFKKKTDMDGAVYIFKARLVAKGFTQTYGVDYEETFSPVADIRAIRILIAIAAYYDYEIWQMDVKTAFLNGHLSEEVYMEQPEASGSYVAILILYVDDILLMGNNIPMLQDVKSYLGRSFAMKDLGEAAYILGIKIYRDRSKRLIGLCQSAYIEKILKRFYMENSKRGTIPMQEKLKLSKSQGASTPAEKQRMQNIPYASAVGSIMYAVRCNMERELIVSCYTDAGYLTDADNLKSQTGYVFILNRGAVDWKSTKQSIFATSSIDAEYIIVFYASKEAVGICKFISGLGIVPSIEEPISMYCDNTGAIAIAKDDGVTKGANVVRGDKNDTIGPFSRFNQINEWPFPKAAAPHMLINGYKNVLALAVGAGYSFPLADRVKEYLEDPTRFVVAAPGAAASGAASTVAEAAPAEEKNEEPADESDDDLGHLVNGAVSCKLFTANTSYHLHNVLES